MTIRSRKYSAILVWVFFATGIILGGPCLTVCVGDCGHFRIETRCSHESDEQGHAEEVSALNKSHSGHNHRGVCLGVAVDGPQWLRRSRLTAGDQLAVAAQAHATSATGLLDSTPGCVNSNRPLWPATDQRTAASGSTTILQC